MRKSSHKMHPVPSSGCVQCAAYGEKFWIRVLWYNFPLVMLFCFSLHHRSGLNCDKNSLKLNNRGLCCLDWACNLIRTGHLNSWGPVWHYLHNHTSAFIWPGIVWHRLHNHTSAFIWPVQRPLEMLGSVLWKSAFIFWTSADGAEHVPKVSHRWYL